MIRKTFPIRLSAGAAEILHQGDGAAPPTVVERGCRQCGAFGKLEAQVTIEGLTIEAPCEHLMQRFSPDPDEKALVVWGGRPGYSVLPPYMAWLLGWKFAQEEPGLIHILGQCKDIVVGLLLMDEEETLSLTRPHHLPCGEQPELPEDLLEFLRQRIRVASMDPRWIAVFQPLEGIQEVRNG